jgi:HD-GYP domain-containing protein (c-di-GMP phosphodiesterase class II)
VVIDSVTISYPFSFNVRIALPTARILAVADAIEDLTSHRVYRNAYPLNDALEEISSKSGSRYDPEVVDVCLKLFREKGFKLESTES